MPCGRCRQLLWEHGGPDCLVDARRRPAADGRAAAARVRPGRPGRGSADAGARGARRGWPRWRGPRAPSSCTPTSPAASRSGPAYWERSGRLADERAETGILEEGPTWPDRGRGGRLGPGPHAAGRRGRRATGDLAWAGEGRRRRAAIRSAATPDRERAMSEPFAAVDVIRAKRDGGVLVRRADRLGRRRVHPGRGRRRADVGAGHGDPAARHDAGRDRPLDRRDDRLAASGWTCPAVAAPDRRQALHRRRRRQDHAAADPAGRRLRRGRAAAVRPRPRPHRRHAGQAGVDPRLAGRADQRGVHRAAARRRRGRSARPARGWPRPTASSTRCATSPARSRRSR